MDMTNNIYGNIKDNQELIITIGNYNNIFSIVSNNNETIQINNLNNINDLTKISRFIIKYEEENDKQFKELFGIPKGNAKQFKGNDKLKLKFTLKLHDNDILYTINNTKNKKDKYLNIKLVNKDTAIAVISEKPRIFWIEYSIIDNSYRSNLLAGSLYLLATNYNNKTYNVQWKINNELNGELIIFLPTTWYEKTDDYCKLHTKGYIQLIDNLKRLSFKGYTTNKWCEEVSYIYNCDINNKCGDCMGSCDDNKICLPNLENNNSKFICDDYTNEDKLYNYEAITFIDNNSTNNNIIDNNDTNNNDNSTNDNFINNNYVLIIIIFIIIITFLFKIYIYK
jgi:hypothetical protein